MIRWKPKKHPWMPADYDQQVIYAVRALVAGKADAGQQGLVWAWVQYVSGVDDQSYRPDSERDTAFAEGKRHVGLELRKMLHPAVTPDDRKQAS